MTLQARELADACAEIERALAGRPVQKIVQPDRTAVELGFHGGWLMLSVHPKLGRIHLMAERPAGTGEAASAFCMLLRKELLGARLTACTPVPGERACELRFAGGRGVRGLRVFLFGKAGQLVLTDEAGSSLGYIGPAQRLHETLPPPGASDAGAERTRFGAESGLSARIEAHYLAAGEDDARATARKAALHSLTAAVDKHRRREVALTRDRARAEAAGEKRKLGDLLLAHLHEVPKGVDSVTLPDDFELGAPLLIALDPARSARANAERFYKEHKRLTRAIATIDQRLAETRAALASAEAELAAVESGEAPSNFQLERNQSPRRKRQALGTPSLPYRAFRAASGATILVGRGADRNDELTFKVARGSDLWMHARDVPGAHVVVPLAAGVSIDEQTLLDAATLAAHHSSARGEAQVDIGYTLRKHVRKPPKSRPGSVTTSGMKTIRVRVEADRLARLLSTSEKPG